jgi:hypothetical protein
MFGINEKEAQAKEDARLIKEWLDAGNKPTICELGAKSETKPDIWKRTPKAKKSKK